MAIRFELAHLGFSQSAQTGHTGVVELAQSPQSKHGLGVDEVSVHECLKVVGIRLKAYRPDG